MSFPWPGFLGMLTLLLVCIFALQHGCEMSIKQSMKERKERSQQIQIFCVKYPKDKRCIDAEYQGIIK